MKKFLFISLIFILSNCGGYEPVFSGKEINFYIEEIENIKNDKISKQIIRRLKPYTIKTDKTNIKLKIESSVEDRIVSKDAKGNEYIIEALQGEIDYSNPNVIYLKNVRAIIKLKNSNNIDITSDYGNIIQIIMIQFSLRM